MYTEVFLDNYQLPELVASIFLIGNMTIDFLDVKKTLNFQYFWILLNEHF